MTKDVRTAWARKRLTPLEETPVEAILAERADTHGDYSRCCEISQDIMRALRKGRRWKDLTDDQVESCQMIAHKLHRIVEGDPSHLDHWLDGAGYFTLSARILERRRKNGA